MMTVRLLILCSILLFNLLPELLVEAQTVTTLRLGVDFDERIYEDLFAKSDLVVVARAISKTNVIEDGTGLILIPEHFRKYIDEGATNFKPLLVLKGTAKENIELVHSVAIPLKEDERVGGLPIIAQFSMEKQSCQLNEKSVLFTPEYMLFLRSVEGNKYLLAGELETTFRSVRVISQF